MSKAILVCFRDRGQVGDFRRSVALVGRRLMPDHVSSVPLAVTENEGLWSIVVNPSPPLLARNGSVCLGGIIAGLDRWWAVGTPPPDGSYALFRGDVDTVELATDAVASRTIWYVQTDALFIAATSQRAIVMLLGSYEPNPNTLPWMLSSGTLGPDNAWDLRIRRLEPDALLRLDRRSWKHSIQQRDVVFATQPATEHEQKAKLLRIMREVFDELHVDNQAWEMLLSGGYDSRAILLLLKNRDGLRCTTWGHRSSAEDCGSDAGVAARLARHFRLNHRYLPIDTQRESPEKAIGRFLSAGEGRIDLLSGYMDGCCIWEQLFNERRGVIRGDEAFGKYPVDNPFEARDCVGLRLLSDCYNLRGIDFGLPQQTVPEYLERKQRESLATWRDRMNQLFELPTVWAALNDVKSAYVELMNPLLSRRVVEYVRTLPDHARTDKSLFRKLVRDLSPPIGFAVRPSIESPRNILKQEQFVSLFLDTFDSLSARRVLPDRLLRFLASHVAVAKESERRRSRVRPWRPVLSAIPAGMRRLAKRAFQRPVLDANVMAFRAYIICRMHEILGEDAQLLAQERR